MLICVMLLRYMIFVLGFVCVMSVFICFGVRFCVLLMIRYLLMNVWLCMKFMFFIFRCEWISFCVVVWFYLLVVLLVFCSILRLLLNVFIYGCIFFFLVLGRKLMFLLMGMVVCVMMILL